MFIINYYTIKERFHLILLLKEVDFRQTKANARNVLKSFRRLERIAGRSLIDLKSPIITEMPKSQSHGNKTEDALVQLADAEAERDAILSALMALSLTSRQILHYSFVCRIITLITRLLEKLDILKEVFNA